jgi:hypothetical protein
MIKEPMLSTWDAPERKGGLLICGTNYGLAPGAVSEHEVPFKPWGEYFTHRTNKEKDKFVSRLAKWFEWWDIPLENAGHPTELNLAISQTNLFYDSSRLFDIREPYAMEWAFNRLKQNAVQLNVSGIIIASAKTVDHAKKHLDIPEWRYVTSGRFWIGIAASSFRVVVCPHPTSYQSRNDVERVGLEMRIWISETLEMYRTKQAERDVANKGSAGKS